MTTRERSEALAIAAAQFPLLGEVTADGLLQVVTSELGHPELLDGFQTITNNNTTQCKALSPATILHILSGNTPQAGLQSLIRGLLLGSHNRCKLPSTGLPELVAFAKALPASLQAQVEFAQDLPIDWLENSDAVIVFGDDTTITRFRSLVGPHQIFLPHGHMVSLAVVFEDTKGLAAQYAAQDISLHDQQGCLSPHAIYVDESGALTARDFAASLADAMEAFNRTSPRDPLSAGESAQIVERREKARFAAAAGEDVGLWHSHQGSDWTVIYQKDATFLASCLNRLVYVKPLPASLAETLKPVRPHLSTIGVWPCNTTTVSEMEHVGASRICPLGRMQSPPLTWHQDGSQTLAPLVRWLDAENSLSRCPTPSLRL